MMLKTENQHCSSTIITEKVTSSVEMGEIRSSDLNYTSSSEVEVITPWTQSVKILNKEYLTLLFTVNSLKG